MYVVQNAEAISIVRIFLFVLANRFKHALSSHMQNDLKSPAWNNMLKLISLVEEFVFHTGLGTFIHHD